MWPILNSEYRLIVYTAMPSSAAYNSHRTCERTHTYIVVDQILIQAWPRHSIAMNKVTSISYNFLLLWADFSKSYSNWILIGDLLNLDNILWADKLIWSTYINFYFKFAAYAECLMVMQFRVVIIHYFQTDYIIFQKLNNELKTLLQHLAGHSHTWLYSAFVARRHVCEMAPGASATFL